MAITYFAVDVGMLKADAENIRQNTVQARRCLEQVSRELNELNLMWKGRANLAFRSQAENDSRQMQELLNQMGKLAESMEHAGKEYGRCENMLESAIRNIRI